MSSKALHAETRLLLGALLLLVGTLGCGGAGFAVEPEGWEPPPGEPVESDATDAGDLAMPGEGATGGVMDQDAGEVAPVEAEPDAGEVEDAGPQPDAGVSPRPDAGTVAPRDAGTPVVVKARTLDTQVVSKIVEPDGSGRDDKGVSYTDANYWNFCVPGAVTAALYFWKPANVTNWPAGYFREPKNAPSSIPAAGTYWKSASTSGGYSSVGRAYLMHLSMQVKPPSFASPGIASFDSYPSTGAGLVDGRDALNWEASGHSAGWKTFHYKIVYGNAATQSTLHTHIKKDIDSGHPVVIFGNTAYMPNWSRTLSHAITVVGYDDTAGTYKFVDTCGKRCNGSANAKNGGVWTITQSKLTLAVTKGAGYLW